MDYQKEYAILVGQVDRTISLLEQYGADDLVLRKAVELLTAALQDAEERYVVLSEQSRRLLWCCVFIKSRTIPEEMVRLFSVSLGLSSA